MSYFFKQHLKIHYFKIIISEYLIRMLLLMYLLARQLRVYEYYYNYWHVDVYTLGHH